jgi:putative membrane protein
VTADPSPAGATRDEQATPPDAGTAGWRRLNPRMLLIYPVQELPRALPALFGLLVAGSSRGNGQLWSLAGIAIVVGLGASRWFTTTYRITSEQIQVRRGLLRRRLLTVPRDRVRTVDVTAHPLHRLLGLARVTVGTGQSDRDHDAGIRLDGLTAAEAAGLRKELLHRRGTAGAAVGPAPAAPAAAAAPLGPAPGAPGPAGAPAAPAPVAPAAVSVPAEVELAHLRPGWIRYGPFTLSGVVTLGLLAGFLSQIVNEAHVDPGRFGLLRDLADQLAGAALWLAILEVVAAAMVVVAVASTIGYALAFWGFRLTRHSGGTLHVTRGLVTIRATTIEERRLRGVEVSEPLLLRAVGGARCIAIATGCGSAAAPSAAARCCCPRRPAPRSCGWRRRWSAGASPSRLRSARTARPRGGAATRARCRCARWRSPPRRRCGGGPACRRGCGWDRWRCCPAARWPRPTATAASGTPWSTASW